MMSNSEISNISADGLAVLWCYIVIQQHDRDFNFNFNFKIVYLTYFDSYKVNTYKNTYTRMSGESY